MGSLPFLVKGRLPIAFQPRPHRRTTGELGRYLDHGLVDGHGHGVQVRGIGLQAKPLGLQRQRSAAREGIMEGWQLIRVEQFSRLGMILVQLAGFAPASPYLGSRPIENLFIGDVLPAHEVFEDFEKPLPLNGSFLLVHPVLEATSLMTRVIDHLRKDHRPRRSQRTTRPPEVHGTWMPLKEWVFLLFTTSTDSIQRQGDFDELLRGFDGSHFLFYYLMLVARLGRADGSGRD